MGTNSTSAFSTCMNFAKLFDLHKPKIPQTLCDAMSCAVHSLGSNVWHPQNILSVQCER